MPASASFRLTFAVALLATAVPLAGKAQDLGGVQGVLSAREEEAGWSMRSARIVAARPVPVPPAAAGPDLAGELRLWMDGYPDRRLPVGAAGRLNLTSTGPGWVMLWSQGADGRVFPIADGDAGAGRALLQVRPEGGATMPSDLRHTATICPPEGVARWLVLHSATPIPDAARHRLVQALNAARIEEAAGDTRFGGVVRGVLAETRGWHAGWRVMSYEIVPGGPAHPGCEEPQAARPGGGDPAPAPAAPQRPPMPPGPALADLRASSPGFEVALSARAYRVHGQMQVTVRAPVACPGLTVLALGAGGAVDVLLPNARPLPRTPAASEGVLLPQPGSGIQLMVRQPPAPGAQERVVALCDTGSAGPLVERGAEDGATATLRPGEPRFAELERRIAEARRAGRLLMGVVEYTNLGGGR